jgi:hypothetical protein
LGDGVGSDRSGSRRVSTLVRRLSKADPATLRAAWWTVRAAVRVRRQLARGGLQHLAVPRSPRLAAHAERGVAFVLRRRRETCLVRSAIWQEYYAAQGSRYDLVIGVTAPGAGFAAHAWLDRGGGPVEGYTEIARRGART